MSIGERAVVLGASMSGLSAARVLSDRFAEVTVIDRDRLPATDEPRRGVPQGRHIHVLISRGQQLVEEMFPGLSQELTAAGVPTLDQLGDVRWILIGHRIRRAPSGLRVLAAGRPLLERRIRDRVAALANVEIVERCDAAGLVTTADRSRVAGARIIRHADGSAEQVLDADLVVDATGRGSRASEWLGRQGCPRPRVDTVELDVGYATAVFRASSVALGGDRGIVMAPTPEHPRGAALLTLESDRCMVALIGVRGETVPATRRDYLEFARSLRYPDVYDAIADAEWVEDVVRYRFRASTWHRYDLLDRFPDGFLVLGDAFCSFDPIYAQGMTVAALEATAMGRLLDDHGPSAAVQRELARVVDDAWAMSTGGDLAFPGVEGRRDPKTRIGNAYVPMVHAAAAYDTRVGTAFARVSGLLDPPSALMHPGIMARVVRQNISHSVVWPWRRADGSAMPPRRSSPGPAGPAARPSPLSQTGRMHT